MFDIDIYISLSCEFCKISVPLNSNTVTEVSETVIEKKETCKGSVVQHRKVQPKT